MSYTELTQILRTIPHMISDITQLTEVLGVLAEPSLVRPQRRNITPRRNATEIAFYKLRKEVRALLPMLESTMNILRLEPSTQSASTVQQMLDTMWSLGDALVSLRSLLDTPQIVLPLHGIYYTWGSFGARGVFRHRLRDLCFLFKELHRYICSCRILDCG